MTICRNNRSYYWVKLLPLAFCLLPNLTKRLFQQTLVNRRDVKVNNLEVNWRKKSPVVTVKVRATNPITPEEVMMIEKSLDVELSNSFKVVFDVTPNTLVESPPPSNLPR